eukprot:TRINITY_DN54917_c0_g1_i1.p1 TRINITY_DN54917_c0_g1~~TRINITY_DN54917_c0_g1_i1.p1  ORF type:complete len:320 (-),score=27.34 TRINITY_DN54917_c0_g1_i1:150-1109(-)
MVSTSDVKYETLLQTSEQETSRRRCLRVRRVVSCVFAFAGLGGLLRAGFDFSATKGLYHGLVLVPGPWRPASTSDVGLRGNFGVTATNKSAKAGVAPVDLTETSSAMCWKQTGTLCKVAPCDEWRHATSVWSDSVCSCDCVDGCVGGDLGCHSARNRLVASEFQLANARWPNSYLYVPQSRFLTQLRVGSLGLGDNHFNLYEVLGTSEGMKKYMITSRDYPDYVIALEPSGNLFRSQWKVAKVSSSSPVFVFWTICRPRNYRGPNLQFGTGNENTGYIWSYVNMFSYLVWGWPQSSGSPDNRGQWIPSAQLDIELDDCP